jgi:hypothetical protein
MRRPGSILLISCYELGHPEQVLGVEPLNRLSDARKASGLVTPGSAELPPSADPHC